MTEAAQTYLTLGTGSEETDNGFYTALNYIRDNANTQYGKGKLFERLIRTYLREDPFYQKRFSEVYLWSEWAELRPEFDSVDLGVDLVAEERDGGYCAIQCKCYAENTRISSADLDTFIAYSNRSPFTARIFVDTAREWSANLRKKLDGLQPACQRISAADLASRPVKWPDLSVETTEHLDYQQETSASEHIRERRLMRLSTASKTKTVANSSWRAARAKPSRHSESLKKLRESVVGCYISFLLLDSSHRRCGNGQSNKAFRTDTSVSARIQRRVKRQRTHLFWNWKSRSPRTLPTSLMPSRRPMKTV